MAHNKNLFSPQCYSVFLGLTLQNRKKIPIFLLDSGKTPLASTNKSKIVDSESNLGSASMKWGIPVDVRGRFCIFGA